MPNDRFYTPEQLVENAPVNLPEDESRHLARVMRVAEGEVIEVINGHGQLARARVDAVQKKHVTLTVVKVHHAPPPTREVILVQAMPRLARLDTIVEKGTELGMTQLWLFPGQRSEKTEISEHQQIRIHAQMVAAIKQCGRLFLPTLIVKPELNRWQGIPHKAFFGDVDPSAPHFYAELNGLHNESIIFFVGPEAGFSTNEERLMRKMHAKGVCLHANILRTDTASLAALTIMSLL